MNFRFLALSLAAAVLASGAHAEPVDSVVALSMDNDLFAPTQTDRDYTAGLAITYSSNSKEFISNPVFRVRQTLDGYVLPYLGGQVKKPQSTALEFGVYGFTPEEIKESVIDRSDRPYSSLVYLSSSQSYQTLGADSGWTTSMTVGVLGLDVFRSGQNAVHKVVGRESARGWGHQISNGGEPTFRYSTAYHQYLDASQPNQRFKVTYFGSVGYLTELGAALVFQGWPDFITRQPLQSRIDGLWGAGARGVGAWRTGTLLLGRYVSQSPRV